MTQTRKPQTPAALAFGRLFPPMTMTAAKAEARSLGVTVRPDPLGPCLDGGRLIEVFPLGCGSSAVSAYDPAEALFWARCFHEDSKANRLGWAGPSKESQVRVIVAAALAARGVGSEGVAIHVNLTPGPSISAEVLATVPTPMGSKSARGHEFATRGPLALMAEELAEELARGFLSDSHGVSLSAMTPETRARFWRLESEYLSALGVNETTAEAARMAERFADSSRSSGPRFYGVAALGFRHAAALFRIAATQTAGHGKRARYHEAAESMIRRADMAEADSAPQIDPAEGLGFGVETVTESAPLMIGAGVMEPEPTPEGLGLQTGAEFKAARDAKAEAEERAEGFDGMAETRGPRSVDVTPSWAGLVPVFRAILENGTPEGVAAVWVELARMAEAADSAVRAARDAKAEERAQIEAARRAEAEARAAFESLTAPAQFPNAAEEMATREAGACQTAEAARLAAEPLTHAGKAPEAQETAARAVMAAEGVKELCEARLAVRAAKRETDKGDSGAGNRAREWQRKAAEAFRVSAEFAGMAGLESIAQTMTRAADLAAGAASNY